MKKLELVYREILSGVIGKRRSFTQAGLSRSLGISLSTVNHAISPLKKMGAVRIKKRSFEVVDAKKILLYWASIRDIEKDIVYRTRAEGSAAEIEKNMPSDVVFGAFSSYKFMLKKMPADYSEVYVYSNNIAELKKRFPESKNTPSLFVLKKEVEEMSLPHLFVDLWNMKEWYAKDFLRELEGKIYGILE